MRFANVTGRRRYFCNVEEVLGPARGASQRIESDYDRERAANGSKLQ
jgi:hypothetical protein